MAHTHGQAAVLCLQARPAWQHPGLQNPAAPAWDEPLAVEREVALGYLPGSTAAEGLSDRDRCSALGQCMDANTLHCLFAIAQSWWFHQQGSASSQQHQQAPRPAGPASGGSSACTGQHSHAPRSAGPSSSTSSAWAPQQQQRPNSGCCSHAAHHGFSFSELQAVFTVAAAQEALAASSNNSEIWTDHPTLTALQQGQIPAALSPQERDRVQQRLKLYRWDQQHQQLYRLLPSGEQKVVPKPEQREQLVSSHHKQCGHFGVRRTAALLQTKYWWHGMLADTAAGLKQCQHCSRVRASFNSRSEQLQPIPISSMGFRWHVDLAGPFPETKRGSRYVMVAVEAFSKVLEAVPIPNKEPSSVAYAFLQHVLARYAAPGQVVTDNGTEFTEGAFAQLLLDSLIDHCTTSVAHPQANGQAKRAVGMVKRALRTMCAANHSTDDWDIDVAWITLAYRCSPNSSSGFSPYELLYARQPVIPPAIRSSMAAPIDYDPSAAATDLLQRKQLVQRQCPEALANLSIAQHRDLKRYAQVRSSSYQPRVYRYQAGDYVYIQQLQRHSTLQPNARPSILRVSAVRPSGVLVLQGKCGRTAEVHQEHCAPCHLPFIDGTVDPLLANETDAIVCEVCNREEPESKLLLCDICNTGYHTHCLQPPLPSIPSGYWLCPQCIDEGATAADAEAGEQQRDQLEQQAALPNIYPDAAMTAQHSSTAQQRKPCMAVLFAGRSRILPPAAPRLFGAECSTGASSSARSTSQLCTRMVTATQPQQQHSASGSCQQNSSCPPASPFLRRTQMTLQQLAACSTISSSSSSGSRHLCRCRACCCRQASCSPCCSNWTSVAAWQQQTQSAAASSYRLAGRRLGGRSCPSTPACQHRCWSWHQQNTRWQLHWLQHLRCSRPSWHVT